jgi:hypothetical protein
VPVPISGLVMSNRVLRTIRAPAADLALPVSEVGDTGAEMNLIDEVVLEGIAKFCAAVAIVSIHPVKVSVAFENDEGASQVSVSRLAKLDLELQLNTTGRLRLRDITFHIADKYLVKGAGKSESVLRLFWACIRLTHLASNTAVI